MIGKSTKIVAWHQIANQLKEIEKDLEHISKMKERYDIKVIEGEAGSSSKTHLYLADSGHFIEEDDIVGIGKERENLIEWLTDGKPARSVIAVWGMGGLGKTTLVTKVYESQIIKKHFDCQAWVSVSQTYGTDDLLKRTLIEFFGRKEMIPYNIDTMTHRNLVETLRSYLQQKSYLVILDDVWSANTWYDVTDALFDSKCGSRIVITTRNENIASLANESHILEIQSLEKNESWNLFCKKAFWKDEDRRCPQVLIPLAEKIVEKCQGLPLAIVAIGSLLSLRKKEESEWKRVHDQLNWESTDNLEMNSVASILNLSYTGLPGYLKNCFLYCSIFPEDYLIKRKRLIRLWIAEGFIEGKRTQTMEEVAEDYLNQLIHRCMLQIVERNYFGRVKACRMHDLVRELTISISRKENFSVICDSPESVRLGDEARRLSVHKSGNYKQLGTGLLQLRSFVVFDINLSSSLLHSVSSTFRLLRVLDLQDAAIEEVADAVFDLFNLHHLGLRRTKVKELPRSLGRLRNLQTLDLLHSNTLKLPRVVTKLKNLRHLFVQQIQDPYLRIFHSVRGLQAPKGIWELRCLQTLESVEATGDLVQGLGSLTQLRSFSITRVRGSHCTDLCASITKMHHLTKLGIMASDEEEVLQLDALNPPPNMLRKLSLRGRLEITSETHLFRMVENLSQLSLSWSRLRVDPLLSVCHMSNLRQLILDKAYDGEELWFYEGWFPNLKELDLGGMTQLCKVIIEKGSLASLRELGLAYLKELKGVPFGILFLTSLQELNLMEMPVEFMGRLRGIDKVLVQHIPKVVHYFHEVDNLVWESLS